MKDKFITIFGLIVFAGILVGILYIGLFTEETKKEVYNNLDLTGNKMQSVDGYLMSCDLNKSVEYPELTLQEVKKRIMEHPYVADAEVQSDGKGTIEVKIFEKEFKAVLLTDQKPFLVSKEFEMINMKINSNISDLPVISNSGIHKSGKPDQNIKCEAMVRAYKIIDALKIVDEAIYKNLTEINLRDGRDVILTFNNIKYPVIFGKSSEGKKIVFLHSIWKEMIEGEGLFANSSYVDLRFNNEIFIGKPVKADNNG